ncbi:MAG TPA: type II secretion system protein [Polyangiaceae bacterium]
MKEELNMVTRRRSLKRGFTLIELMIVVAIIGILAVLAIYGVSRYLKSSKTAEATNNIGAIQNSATEALAREKMSGAYVAPGGSVALAYGFCATEPGSTATTAAVPTAVPKGEKFVSGAGDWAKGKGAGNGGADIGFYCLKFEVTKPQYYSYGYTATGAGTNTGDAVDIVAQGDLDGNGVTSLFVMHGEIASQNGSNSLVWAPKPAETNPEE